MMQILNQDPGYCQPWIRDGKVESGMFILGPGSEFFHPGSEFFHPGSEFFHTGSRIQGQKDCGSRIWINNLSIFNLKNGF
jgi:hypothetical protein